MKGCNYTNLFHGQSVPWPYSKSMTSQPLCKIIKSEGLVKCRLLFMMWIEKMVLQIISEEFLTISLTSFFFKILQEFYILHHFLLLDQSDKGKLFEILEPDNLFSEFLVIWWLEILGVFDRLWWLCVVQDFFLIGFLGFLDYW